MAGERIRPPGRVLAPAPAPAPAPGTAISSSALIWAIVALGVIGTVGTICITIWADHDVRAGLVGSVLSLVLGMSGALIGVLQRKAMYETRELRLQVNGRIEQLLAATASSSRAEGNLEGRDHQAHAMEGQLRELERGELDDQHSSRVN